MRKAVRRLAELSAGTGAPGRPKLHRFAASSKGNLGLFLLSNGADVVHLNGTSSGIHQLNGRGVRLTEENVLEYLAFFCFFVRGESGPFLLVDRLDNPLLPSELREANPDRRVESAKEVHRLYRPPETFGRDDENRIRASAMVLYSDGIFVADFLIGAQGNVEMLEDEPLITDLGYRSDVAIA